MGDAERRGRKTRSGTERFQNITSANNSFAIDSGVIKDLQPVTNDDSQFGDPQQVENDDLQSSHTTSFCHGENAHDDYLPDPSHGPCDDVCDNLSEGIGSQRCLFSSI